MLEDISAERPLFGGVIFGTFTLRFEDISNIFQVPDHQVSPIMTPIHRLYFNILKSPSLNPTTTATAITTAVVRHFSCKTGDNEWNDAWETAWLPDDLSGKTRAPWETDVNFSLSEPSTSPTSPASSQFDMDSETKAFVEDMNENWDQRKGKPKIVNESKNHGVVKKEGSDGGAAAAAELYSLENVKRDYRLKKQRVHAGLWVKEIEKMEEAKLGDSISGAADDIEKLLDSCSEIFDSPNDDLNNTKIAGTEFKNKPDGWESTSRAQDGNIWEMTQREEDILLQEYERRIAFNKFQIASFIKTHIFSRRRPIDGWKYMIEVIGPNAKKGKGSVSRLPSVSDAATQPFKEEKTPISNTLPSYRGR